MSNSDPNSGGAEAPQPSLEDLKKMADDLAVQLGYDRDRMKMIAEVTHALIEMRKEPIKIEPGATNPRGWQEKPPTEAQVKSITRFKLQPLQGMTRGELAEIIDILKQHPPTGKRIIRDRGQDR